ncbi:MAG: bifunctional (p)ppGpp synthetase/guanosine-3',5'-bis(diphosphate) 3'-pyrophosphohydrolase [Proteobacteria bacterium]|nr:MAG: bifunctional (p)ppGpp synthetase/guanosine-3',5'-bis(diphosphate) 3'-pyrophosphohydrolase [Pseudomonadota bacterium]
MTDPTLFIRALAFAAEKHKAQRRLDAEANPYINHPIALTRVLSVEGGVTDTEVLCAALLHDTIEDTDCTADELRQEFGAAITAIVLEVTDDTSQPKPVRKQAQIDKAAGASTGAKLVKLADKICNLRDVLRSPPPGWSYQRKQDYFVWAGKVLVGLRRRRGRNPSPGIDSGGHDVRVCSLLHRGRHWQSAVWARRHR